MPLAENGRGPEVMWVHRVLTDLQFDLLFADAAFLLYELYCLGYLTPERSQLMPLILPVHPSQVVCNRFDVGVIVVLSKTFDSRHNQSIKQVGALVCRRSLSFPSASLLHANQSKCLHNIQIRPVTAVLYDRCEAAAYTAWAAALLFFRLRAESGMM